MRKLLLLLLVPTYLYSQDPPPPATPQVEGLTRSDQDVQLPAANRDHLIEQRLRKILDVTGWFKDLKIESKEGVVIFRGFVTQQSHADWAESLAKDTEGVVAVMNQSQVQSTGWFDLTPAKIETESFIRRMVRRTPYILASALVVIVFAIFAIFMNQLGHKVVSRRIRSPLLIELCAKLFALPVVILGFYLVLRVLGLTGMAVTVLGGTGAFGLIAGFAAKNILENYFSGIMLSFKNPYKIGDVIDVAGKMGVVQKLTTRATILVDFDGNSIIIPNSMVYGNIITNLTANPSLRLKFSIGISYEAHLPQVREFMMDELHKMPEVLKDPEPLALVSDFKNHAVIFDIYFWIDPNKSSGFKVKSLVMELIKARLEDEEIEIPNQIHQVIVREAIDIKAIKEAHHQLPISERINTASEAPDLLKEAGHGRNINHGERLL